MKRHKLAVEKRKIIGKKVKKLRKEGFLPANIYGKGVKSLAVQLPYKEFEKVYKEAGVTGIIDVEVGGEVRPSLIHNVQQDYYSHTLLHADFFQVNLKEKVKTMVKVVAVGIPKAVSEKLGLLLQPLPWNQNPAGKWDPGRDRAGRPGKEQYHTRTVPHPGETKSESLPPPGGPGQGAGLPHPGAGLHPSQGLLRHRGPEGGHGGGCGVADG